MTARRGERLSWLVVNEVAWLAVMLAVLGGPWGSTYLLALVVFHGCTAAIITTASLHHAGLRARFGHEYLLPLARQHWHELVPRRIPRSKVKATVKRQEKAKVPFKARVQQFLAKVRQRKARLPFKTRLHHWIVSKKNGIVVAKQAAVSMIARAKQVVFSIVALVHRHVLVVAPRPDPVIASVVKQPRKRRRPARHEGIEAPRVARDLRAGDDHQATRTEGTRTEGTSTRPPPSEVAAPTGTGLLARVPSIVDEWRCPRCSKRIGSTAILVEHRLASLFPSEKGGDGPRKWAMICPRCASRMNITRVQLTGTLARPAGNVLATCDWCKGDDSTAEDWNGHDLADWLVTLDAPSQAAAKQVTGLDVTRICTGCAAIGGSYPFKPIATEGTFRATPPGQCHQVKA